MIVSNKLSLCYCCLWCSLFVIVANGMTTSNNDAAAITIKGLYRHPVKGLSADELDSVTVQAMESFPDDRRFALLKQDKEKFDESNPEWIHKSNFLCAFSAPQLMAKYKAHYHLKLAEASSSSVDVLSLALPNDEVMTGSSSTKRLLSLYERETNEKLLDSVDLSTEGGRQVLADLFSDLSGESLSCVTADNFQFGNTSSGVKKKGNTRTIHIINAATVREFSKAIGVELNPTRFRPNIVIDNLQPWEEFNWVGQSIQCGEACRMDVLSRTVRCDAVSVDPLVFPDDILDIPPLLVKYFPEHGPYLGIYCHIEKGGIIKVGDSILPP